MSVLIHEHYHAILATGLDDDGRTPAAARNPELWAKGQALDESLAAWMQRHTFRHDPEMFKLLADHIRTGDYPEWPYRGAETVEDVFKKEGLEGVRRLVGAMRADPEFAQYRFDELVAAD